MAEREIPAARDPSGTIGRNIEAFVLLELVRRPSYGRDLIRCLDDYGFRRATTEPGVVYKVLRSLEDRGSIRSTWTTRESGPARRYYEITPEGMDLLHHRVDQLHRYMGRIERLLSEYRELTGNDLAAGPSADDNAPRELVLAASPSTERPEP
jgi:DNA-binding PadR family transcriptional regulator